MSAAEWAILIPAVVGLLGAITAHMRISRHTNDHGPNPRPRP